ncbi:MAG: cobalt-precorrin-7 (C(5))-methyltransferase [Methanotrichaceae archaeon]|nr:cobalt-precorrin-7 (C(5))-methyltransferase [Methanotrichaceae archaeon]
MKVVGVGAGPGMLTEEAIRAIEGSRLIYGSPRAIEIASPSISPSAKVKVIRDYKALRDLPEEAVVLSTGDPLLSGLGFLGGEIVPGISSMQVACARLRLSLLKVVPITVHGRRMDTDGIAFEIDRGKTVFLLVDEASDLAGLCRHLEEAGLSRDLVIMSDLGYPEEHIAFGSTRSPPAVRGLSSVLIGEIERL